MTEPLTDDQHTRLRELHERAEAAATEDGTATEEDYAYWDAAAGALPALLDEIDRLGDRVADLELDNEGLQRTLAENDRLQRHARIGDDELRRERDQAEDERDRLREENAELQALFDLQWTRMGEAVEAWRAADPDNRESVIPDLGELLTWLLDRVRCALDERDAVARAAASEIHPGPDGADDDIRRELIARWMDDGSDDATGWRDEYLRATTLYASTDVRLRGLIEAVRQVCEPSEGSPYANRETRAYLRTAVNGAEQGGGE